MSIRRLSATVTDWPDPDWVPQMLQHVAGGRLDEAVRSSSLPDGEWCVRRVDLAVQLDPERPASALETEWADRIVLALRQSLKNGNRDVVRYERREDALDELLAGLAVGQVQHDWAWRLVGLVEPGDPPADGDPRQLCLRVLGRLPHGVASSVSRLVRRVGPAATHRLLGTTGWSAVAALTAAEVGVSVDHLVGPDGAAPNEPPPTDPAASTGTTSVPGASPAHADGRAQRVARGLCASSFLADAFQGSELRVTRATRRHWAVLVLAETDPGALRRADATALVPAVAEVLDRTVGSGLGRARTSRASATRARAGVDGPAPTTGPGNGPLRVDGVLPTGDDVRRADRTDPPDRAGPADAGQATDTTDDTSTADPEATVGEATSWGGLLFLLNTAVDAGLPDALQEEPLLDRPTVWLLGQLGTRLVPAADDDPAVLALGGLDPGLAAAQSQAEGPTAASLDECAARWVATTAARLRASASGDWPGSDEVLVRRLARRHAVVFREPGWVEVRLRLDDVDLDVRRAGLDLDPGWVWWLGQVVRFDYE